MIPYSRHWIDEDDIEAVVEVLRSDWLTTGPMVQRFEEAFARTVGSADAVAVSSGTAALHVAMFALGVGNGDEVIVPSITFAATANCVVYQGGIPVFADVEPGTLLIDTIDAEAKVTPRTKAIIAVDYAGQPCDYDALNQVAERNRLSVVSDACHSLGSTYRNTPIGKVGNISAFSLHPAKHITSGEGGVLAISDPHLAKRARSFRNHGINADLHDRERRGTWFYEMTDLGYNYRITDFQCALGLSQLEKLAGWVTRRQEIAQKYDEAFHNVPGVEPLTRKTDVSHAYHLYVIRLDKEALAPRRNEIMSDLRLRGIGANVHYIPVHLHPFYRKRFGTGPGLCPQAEEAYSSIISLPLFPRMTDAQVEQVITAVRGIVAAYLDQEPVA